MPEQRRVEIDGTEYLLTRNQWGWAVSPLSSPTDRFHRNYQVHVDGRGRPLRCSCAACVRGGSYCKHLKTIEKLFYTENEEARNQLREEAIRSGFLV